MWSRKRKRVKEKIKLKDGSIIKRVITHTPLGNWSFPTVMIKGKEHIVEKVGKIWKIKRQLGSRRR